MLNIVIPMAGRGSRFKDEGFDLPKPLIPVNGKPMVQLVVDNLRPQREHRFLFICLREHLDGYGLAEKLAEWAPGSVVIPIDAVTQGAACTVLLMEKYIDSADPLLIANCDQWIDTDIDAFLTEADRPELSGLIMTMKADDPKWSFVKFGQDGEISAVLEKQVVSDEATVGIYHFKKGSEFVAGAQTMIREDRRVNGEFYVAPVYNELIVHGAKLGVFNIGSVGDGMYGLGVPSDLRAFLQASKHLAGRGLPG
jgi:NDP-sugar pyrophosphorylase family protein